MVANEADEVILEGLETEKEEDTRQEAEVSLNR